MNILVFRTDRIGDFILTSIFLNGLKNKFKNCKIFIIASEKNYEFIKKNHLVYDVFLYPKKNILKKINFYLKLKKYNFDYIFVADGKDRSIFFSFFLNAKIKIYNIRKKIFNFLKILPSSFVFYDNENDLNKIDIIKKNLNILKCDFKEDFLNIFQLKKIESRFNLSLKKIIQNDYIIFHLDEKWINKYYISDYQNIEPNIIELENFLKKLFLKKKKNILVTSGIESNYLFDNLKKNSKIFQKDIFIQTCKGYKIIICDKTSIEDLIFLISKSSMLICCHGAPTHIASSLNVKIVDIIEKYKDRHYNKYSAHLRNYNKVHRKSFIQLSKEIINLS